MLSTYDPRTIGVSHHAPSFIPRIFRFDNPFDSTANERLEQFRNPRRSFT
jgi:hypothetical protein